MLDKKVFTKIHDYLWEIPREFRRDMRVPARVYAHEGMLSEILEDKSLEQLVNVAALPGIQKYALAMPDVHEGYGMPVGGVAAFDTEEGVISPGAVGYDINCGVRLLRTDIPKEEVIGERADVGRSIFAEVPSGVGRGGRLDLKGDAFDAVLAGGAKYMHALGYAEADDLERIESGGALEGADPALVSEHAKNRGGDQLGTMGAGNHFVEVGYIETVFDEDVAEKMNLREGGVTVLIHTGSRGLGHQVATDYIRTANKALRTYGFELPDRELASMPFKSKEGQEYFAAMKAAANFAWANRQLITWEVREAFKRVFKKASAGLSLVYDVAHNLAKQEAYEINGKKKDVIVHRKGATRAFPDQPVLIPGSMGTASYVLIGGEESITESFGSTCHGAGRIMSRAEARKNVSAETLRKQLKEGGIVVNAGSRRGLTEEAPAAYKDVEEVVRVVHEAGIATKVARLRPLAVIKG